MRYNYDDENRTDFINQPDSGISPPQDSVIESVVPEEHTADEAIQEPAREETVYMNRTEPQMPQEPQEPQGSGAPQNSLDMSAIPRGGLWSEPVYSEAPRNSSMYTPGINTQQYYSRHKMEENRTEQPKEGGKRRGGFLRAVCLAVACAVLSAGATYGVIEYRIRNGDISPVNQVVLGNTSNSPPVVQEIPAPIAATGEEMAAQDIYVMACSQVVGVKTEAPGMSDMFQSSTTAVSGSGFIISVDGYILTNYHVIETAYRNGLPLKVVFNDGTTHDAKIIGFDSSNDVAVIKIDAQGLNAVVVGDSDKIKVGERVYAVGNPFGELVYTMTEGIVSGLDRTVSVDMKSISTFQISAAVNSGNSGGPVYDSKGEVIGIVTAKFSNAGVEGIGFAIPVNDAIDLALDLIENGYISGRAYMGIGVRTFTKAFAEYYASVEGAYVLSVTPDSAADKAGIKVGDIITKLGEAEVISEETLIAAKNKFKAGETTTLIVRRSGDDIELTITFDEDMTAQHEQQQQQAQQQQPQQQPQYGNGEMWPGLIIPSP